MRNALILFAIFAFAGEAIAQPAAPSNLVRIPAPKAAQYVDLSWQDNSGGEAAFIVYRRNSRENTFTAIAILLPGDTSYRDSTVQGSKAYFYYVTAFDCTGESGPSNTIGPISIIARP